MRRSSLALAAVVAATDCSLLFAHVDDSKIFDRIPAYVGPAYSAGEGGLASPAVEQFTFSDVTLLSWLPLSEWPGAANANVVEGYVAPSGREYALLGLSNGTAVVEVTDPSNAQKIAFLEGPSSLWRDIRVFGQHAYAVSEGGGGIQVFDLTQVDSGTVSLANTVTTGGSSSTHTVFVNQASGYLYRSGGSGNGLRIYSLADPVNPTFVAEWQDRYVHEVTVASYTSGPYAGKEIAFCCGGLNNGFLESGISILDVTDKSNIQVLSIYLYPDAQYSHQGWLTADKKYFYLNDEKDEQNLAIPGTTRIINVEDLANPVIATTYTNSNSAIDHNLYVRDNLAFLSNYRSGLRIVDVTNPLVPFETGFFDTFPGSDSPNFNGLWDNDPYLPSGIVLGADIERGLFVWYVGPSPLTFTFPGGLPSLLAPAGQALEVSVAALAPWSVVPGSIKLNVLSSQGPSVVDMTESSPGVYSAMTPTIPCGESVSYSFTAKASNGITLSAPSPGAPAVAATGSTLNFADDMEVNSGWSVGAAGDNALAGQWVRVDPNGTTAQPEDDNPAGTGTKCWVTAQGSPGGQAGEADIDAGVTTLISPIFDGIGEGVVTIEYTRWYSNNLGNNPNQDSMPVSLSNDGGQTWTLLETVTENSSAWIRRSYVISAIVPPTTQMRLKFAASDLGSPSLVEAGVDDVRVVRYSCTAAIPGDLDGNGVVDGGDLGTLLGQWGGPGSADLDGNGTVDGADLGLLLGNWS